MEVKDLIDNQKKLILWFQKVRPVSGEDARELSDAIHTALCVLIRMTNENEST